MRNALIVAWKEFRTFFQTPIAYVILFIFTAIGSWWFFMLNGFFAQREASIRGLLFTFPWLFLFLAPAITMRLWAEERRIGTIETLLTLPMRDWEIAVGKFLASLGLIAVWLVTLLPLVGVVFALGSPDRGPIIGGMFAALLLGGGYAAIGLAASAITENQIISLVVALALCFFFYLVGSEWVVPLFPDAIGGFLHNLSMHVHFESITRGVVDSRDLLFYLSFIAFFLTANVALIRRRRGSGTTVLLAAGILLFANYLTSSHFFRIDLTKGGRYTLSTATKRVLGSLDDDLRLTAYLSGKVPSNFANVRRDIEDTVHEFESYAKDKHLKVEIVDTDKSEKEKEAATKAGIEPRTLPGGSEDELNLKASYLGIVVEYRDKSEKLPFIGGTDTLEYDLIRRVAKITRKGSVKIAWQVSDPMAGMNFPGMAHPPGSDKHTPSTDLRAIDQYMKEECETTTVDLKSRVPDDVKVVVLCNPEGMTDTQKFWADQFLMRGGGLIVLADGSQIQSFGGMPGGQGNPLMRSGNDKLPEDFFSHYGFTINKDVVLDLQCAGIRWEGRPVRYPGFVVATANSIDQDHPITANFTGFMFMWPSSITLSPKPGVKAIELVRSSDQAKHLENFMMLSPAQILPDSKEKAQVMMQEYKNRYVLAGLLEGEFQSYFVAHPVPKEVVEGKPAPASGPDAIDPAAGIESPFPVAPADDKKESDEAKAKSKPEEGDAKEKSKSDDGGAKPDGDTKPSGGGPRVDDEDVPGGGVAQAQNAPPAPVPAPAPAPASAQDQAAGAAKGEGGKVPESKAAEPKKQDEKAAAEKKPFEYLKQSTAPGRILVIGTSEFIADGTVRDAEANILLMLNAAGYMASSDDLSSLRAKRLDEHPFDRPSDTAKNLSFLLGGVAPPVLLIAALVLVYAWRRVWRPAASRRRMAAAAAR